MEHIMRQVVLRMGTLTRDLDLTHITSFATFARLRAHCACGATRTEPLTNGDGALLDVCVACGRARPVGRFWTDLALGPRSGSVWSGM